jgi:hypothetical protein
MLPIAEANHFYAGTAPSKNFDLSPAALTPDLNKIILLTSTVLF